MSHVFFYNFFGRRGAGTTLAQPGWDNPYAAGQAFLDVQIRRPKGSPKPPRCAQRASDTAAQGRDEAHRPTHWAAPCHPPEWPPEFLKILGNGFFAIGNFHFKFRKNIFLKTKIRAISEVSPKIVHSSRYTNRRETRIDVLNSRESALQLTPGENATSFCPGGSRPPEKFPGGRGAFGPSLRPPSNFFRRARAARAE